MTPILVLAITFNDPTTIRTTGHLRRCTVAVIAGAIGVVAAQPGRVRFALQLWNAAALDTDASAVEEGADFPAIIPPHT